MTALDAPVVVVPRVLSGPPATVGFERLEDHLARLGPRPVGGPGALDVLREAGLRGRGGAGFPTWRKWGAVAEHSAGDAVVVVNASEGEAWSVKDQTILTRRPHLVLDGALIAAETVGARDVYIYLGRPFGDARESLEAALRQRRKARLDRLRVRIVDAPHRYIAGEESALVHLMNGGPAKPVIVPPRPFEQGVGRRPTLVQNTETMAHVALLTRFGAPWFRLVGTESSPGTALLTLSGAVEHAGVYELALHATIGDAVAVAGGVSRPPQAVLLGGYFGTWIPWERAGALALDDVSLKACDGASLGCGVIAVLPEDECGLEVSWEILDYLAGESAGQCGPCVHGLASLARVLGRVVHGDGRAGDAGRLRRWMEQVSGRGACRHPDGAVRHLASALRTFSDDLDVHLRDGTCGRVDRPSVLPAVPMPGRGWR